MVLFLFGGVLETMHGAFRLDSWADIWNLYNWYWNLERVAWGDNILNLDWFNHLDPL